MPKIKIMKGRQKGQTKRMSIIKDKAITPYEIHIDDEQYILVDSIKQKPMGYFTELNGIIKKITQMNIVNKNETFTLKEFLTEYNNIKNELTQQFK
jgi:hypothetical protein